MTYRGSGALGVCVGEEARARNLVFFHGKWLQPAMKVTSCVRRVRVRSFRCVIGSPLVCVLQRVVAHVCVVKGCFGICGCRSHCPIMFYCVLHSMSRYRIVLAASRLLGAAAACVILVSCAAGHCKSSWSGCIKAAIVISQQSLALVISRFSSFFKVLPFCVFFEIRFWRCNISHHCA